METFYVDPLRVVAGTLTLLGDEHRHLVRVLRAAPGDRIAVVDGAGVSYDAVITSISQHDVQCRIEERHPGRNELPVSVTIAPALLKNPGRFDIIVEKATELGAVRIVPLQTARVIGAAAKMDRWSGIALAAMKQCGRCVLPAVEPPVNFKDFLGRVPPGALKLIPHERASLPLSAALSGYAGGDIVICIGPEGGFAEGEITLASEAGFVPVRLGDRRLRAETAAVAALAAVMLAAR
jgi:16S rRNA (uracil1498-N3)-methyltransferase